jgi:hypothetical protein
VKIPTEPQKRELAELKRSEFFGYLNDSRTELVEQLILADPTRTQVIQGRVMELTDLIDYITKSYDALARGPASKQNLKFPG